MSLRHMRIFVAVCSAGSMTAAAKQLFLSQPAVSLAISELEQDYNVKLFDRISNKLRLTESGEQLRQYAEHIVYLYDEMEQRMRNSEETGTLRVGTTHNLGGFFLPQKVVALQKLYPDLKITAKSDKLEVIVLAILQNELDVAVVEGEVDDPYIQSVQVGEDPIMFICPPGHPFEGRADVELSEVVKEPILLRTKDNSVRNYFDGMLAAHGYHIEPTWECGSNFPLTMGVHNGIGIGVLPRLHAHEVVGSRQCGVFNIKGLESPSTKISAIYHRNKHLTKSAKDFIDLWKQGSSGEYFKGLVEESLDRRKIELGRS